MPNSLATYIDLNPVRAGMGEDPGSYRWCGYAEAMTGDAQAVAGLVRITGQTAANVYGQALGTENYRCDPLQEKFPVYASMHFSHIF